MAKKAAKFNPDEQRVIARAAQQVWDEIGGDCLQALADDKGHERVTMSRRDVIEVVLDASRFEDALARLLRRETAREGCTLDPQLHARAVADIYGRPSAIERYLKTDVFKHTRYGF